MRQIISDKRENTRYLFIDVETGNLCLHEIYNLPWQISFIRVQNNKIIKEYDYLLKWKPGDFFMSRGAAEMTGYDQDLVDRIGVEPESIADILLEELEAADHICGHNILGLDTYLIQAYFRKLGRKPFNIATKPLDTFSIAKGLRIESFPKNEEDLIKWQYRMYHTRKKGLNKLKLGDLGKEFNIDHDYSTLHDALSDLRLNIKVFNQLKHSFTYTN
jgi:exonuclease I